MENVQSTAQQWLVGSLMVLLAAVGFSAKAVLVKLAYGYSAGLDAITLMTLRMLFALPFFLVVAFWSQSCGRCRVRQSSRGINTKTKRIAML